MADAEIHVGDEGTLIKVTILDENGAIVPLDDATVKKIFLKPPTGAALEKTAAFFTDGSDGILTYQVVAADFSVSGLWQIQGYVELPGGKWHSEIKKFKVAENIS
jgi:hypothetical protein